MRCWLASIWQSFRRETVVKLMRPSNDAPSNGSTSKRPQRSVSASDQRWIWLFGEKPEVLSERIVSDMFIHRFMIETQRSAAGRRTKVQPDYSHFKATRFFAAHQFHKAPPRRSSAFTSARSRRTS